MPGHNDEGSKACRELVGARNRRNRSFSGRLRANSTDWGKYRGWSDAGQGEGPFRVSRVRGNAAARGQECAGAGERENGGALERGRVVSWF